MREWEGVAEPLRGTHVARGFTPRTHSSALGLTLRTRILRGAGIGRRAAYEAGIGRRAAIYGSGIGRREREPGALADEELKLQYGYFEQQHHGTDSTSI